jgi:hypothetical protein
VSCNIRTACGANVGGCQSRRVGAWCVVVVRDKGLACTNTTHATDATHVAAAAPATPTAPATARPVLQLSNRITCVSECARSSQASEADKSASKDRCEDEPPPKSLKTTIVSRCTGQCVCPAQCSGQLRAADVPKARCGATRHVRRSSELDRSSTSSALTMTSSPPQSWLHGTRVNQATTAAPLASRLLSENWQRLDHLDEPCNANTQEA